MNIEIEYCLKSKMEILLEEQDGNHAKKHGNIP
jgi:hypothetical protein